MRLVYLLLLLNLALSLPAQTELQRRPHVTTEYILGPGDQFVLHVADMDEISDKPLRVDPGGFVDLPLAGRMEVSGLSLEQLKSELKAKPKPLHHRPLPLRSISPRARASRYPWSAR